MADAVFEGQEGRWITTKTGSHIFIPNDKSVKEVLQDRFEDYEEMFGELPPIPKCGSYSTIVDLMEEAMIAKKPLTWNDVIDSFDDISVDLV